MKNNLLVHTINTGLFWGISSMVLNAASPIWTFSAPNPAQVTVYNGQTATVTYTVTNQSFKPKNLILKSIPGVSASPCILPSKGSSCTLTLTIYGSQIPQQGIHGGPVLCDQGSSMSCYQPSAPNELQINHSPDPSPPSPQGPLLPAHLLLSRSGNPITRLPLMSGDSGSLILTNTGQIAATGLTIHLPFAWEAYFNNNCPTELAPQQSCTLTYSIPSVSATGILNPLTLNAINTDNNLKIPTSIQTIGAAKCWGINNYGQLGSTINSGTSNPNNSPLDVQTLGYGVIELTSNGSPHTCALLNNGAVKCWGSNEYGQLGSTTSSGTTAANNTPLDVQNLSSGVLAINAGYAHTCALGDNGSIKCWGQNNYGQLGSPDNSSANNIPVDVPAFNSGVVALASGMWHTCALLDTGAVKCWGGNLYGQLGSTTNSGTNSANSNPLDVQTLDSDVVAITSGAFHTCALLNNGTVKCWGDNQYGQLGATLNSGTALPNNSPLDVQNLSSGVVAISGGTYHTCALMHTGAVKCWGRNYYGELGSSVNNGTNIPNHTPQDVQTLNADVVAINTGGNNTCALMNTGSIKCWGLNRHGQLGSTTNSGTNASNSSPLDVQNIVSAGKLMSGTLTSISCAIVP